MPHLPRACGSREPHRPMQLCGQRSLRAPCLPQRVALNERGEPDALQRVQRGASPCAAAALSLARPLAPLTHSPFVRPPPATGRARGAQRYNFVQSFSACVREWLSSRAKGLRRAGTWRKMWRRCKAALESGRSPACCAARLAMQSLFLLFSVAQGRLVLLLGAHIWSAVGELDAAVDRAVLPEKLLRTLEGVFPALNAWEGVHSKVFFQSVGSLHVSFTGSDLVVGALFSSLNCHLYSLWCLGRELQPPLLPCPVHDMADLWEMLFPLPEQAASFCGIILPLLIYVGRKLLLWCVGLPMDALELSFITGENLGLHIGLGLGLGAILLLVLEMGDALVHDFATWSSMAERRAVASRGRRGRRRAGAAAAESAAAGAATG